MDRAEVARREDVAERRGRERVVDLQQPAFVEEFRGEAEIGAALLESALQLFTEKGFTQTSLDEVTAAARLTKGALYHHFASKFASKQALFEESWPRSTPGSPRRSSRPARARTSPGPV
ncbi:helix-turn-helix domain-containing protein [Streptomyces bluensis]|uniref:helix-turn-helix domain-containing protein n=1 Tax=Streptomyces bluensis TaxID=33897 RepID=UPI0036A8266D